jgi:hypothetical protein
MSTWKRLLRRALRIHSPSAHAMMSMLCDGCSKKENEARQARHQEWLARVRREVPAKPRPNRQESSE